MKKLLLFLVVILMIAITFTGCGGSKASREKESLAKRDQGLQLVTEGKMDEAAKVLREATKSNPEDSKAQFLLGIALYNQQDFQGAIKAYEKAIAIDPKNVEAYNNLGNVYRDQKNYEKAEEYYRKAIEVNTLFSYGYTNLALMLDSTGKKADAVGVLELGAKNMPTNLDLLSLLGNFYIETKDWNKAIATYEQILTVDPNHKDAKTRIEEIKDKVS